MGYASQFFLTPLEHLPQTLTVNCVKLAPIRRSPTPGAVWRPDVLHYIRTPNVAPPGSFGDAISIQYTVGIRSDSDYGTEESPLQPLHFDKTFSIELS